MSAVAAALEFAERAPEGARTRLPTGRTRCRPRCAAPSSRGSECLREVAAGALPPAPVVVLLGMAPTELGDGRVVFGREPAEEHYNPIGMVHAVTRPR